MTRLLALEYCCTEKEAIKERFQRVLVGRIPKYSLSSTNNMKIVPLKEDSVTSEETLRKLVELQIFFVKDCAHKYFQFETRKLENSRE